jgi:hypothetical protein
MAIPKNSDDFINEIVRRENKERKEESNIVRFEEVSKKECERFEERSTSNRGKSSFRVLDICNPMQAYYDIITGNVPNPEEIEKKFKYGKFIEGRVSAILYKDIINEQGYVDGSSIGMPDVKGKIDFRIGERIIELKTSEYDIPDKDTLFKNNPQDLEQILLYILFTERAKNEHVLIYLIGKHPSLIIRQFRVKIKNEGELKKYFELRYNKLKKALDAENPQGLGKCRYFDSACKFKLRHLCKCENEEIIDIKQMIDSVFVDLASGDRADIEKKLIEAHLFDNYDRSIGIWDIFAPRRWFKKYKNPYEYEEWADDNKELYDLRKNIENEAVKEKILIRRPLSDDLPEMKDHLFFKPSKAPDIINSQDREYPILIRVKDKKEISSRLNDIYIAQIGLACALSNTKTGYVFIFYRNDKVGRKYRIDFSDLGKIYQEAREIVKESIKSAKENEMSQILPLDYEIVSDK